MATAALGLGGVASHARAAPPANDPPRNSGTSTDTKGGGSAEAPEGIDGGEETPKPAAPKQGRFDAKAFFAAWGTENAEFDHDGSGTVDCPDLEFAIRAAGGGRAPVNPGTIILTTPTSKDGTINARSSLPSTLVKAWGTSAANFDFDGNGVVGCGDVSGFIAHDLKPLKPGMKAPEAPPVDPGIPVHSPSLGGPEVPQGSAGGISNSATVSGGTGGAKADGGRLDGGGGGSASSPARSQATGGGGGAASGRSKAPSASKDGGGGGPRSRSGSGDGTDAFEGGSGSGGGDDDGGAMGTDDREDEDEFGLKSDSEARPATPRPKRPARDPAAIRAAQDAASRPAMTRTLTYAVGAPGTDNRSEFSWTVTKVTASGTFLDGNPWVTVAPGAEVIDLSPKSVRKTTAGGLNVYISGTGRNPQMRYYYAPEDLALEFTPGSVFDGRLLILAKGPTQEVIDRNFDQAGNLGLPESPSGRIRPFAIEPGDVVVTADSAWSDRNGAWPKSSLPHVSDTKDGLRSGIKRFGVLTVLHVPPDGPSFRPPMQWPRGDEANRASPLPRSRVRTDDQPLRHLSPDLGHADPYLNGATFHEGHGVQYQCSHAQKGISENPNFIKTYGGAIARGPLQSALLAATNYSLSQGQRERARDRLIQYGIDCYGAAMCFGDTSAGAGQRAAEMKPWIILAGWWTQSPEMVRIYDTVREYYSGTAVAGLDDAALGNLLFHDDFVCREVRPGIGLGAGYAQSWGPGESQQVVDASLANSARLCNAETVQGRFGQLQVSGFKVPPRTHSWKEGNYYGMCLKVTAGPGSGPTVYRILQVSGGSGGSYRSIVVDRPWQAGPPGPSSRVKLFPFAIPDFEPGLDDDVGRWYYAVGGQGASSRITDDLSPMNESYAGISFRAMLAPHAALRRLAIATGDLSYVRGTTWNWLSEVVGGTGKTPSGKVNGDLPDQQRITNQFWSANRYVQMRSNELKVIRQWLGTTSSPSSFGAIDRARIPGTRP